MFGFASNRFYFVRPVRFLSEKSLLYAVLNFEKLNLPRIQQQVGLEKVRLTLRKFQASTAHV